MNYRDARSRIADTTSATRPSTKVTPTKIGRTPAMVSAVASPVVFVLKAVLKLAISVNISAAVAETMLTMTTRPITAPMRLWLRPSRSPAMKPDTNVRYITECLKSDTLVGFLGCMAKNTLTKMEKLEALTEALRAEIQPGIIIPVPVWRRIIAKSLNLVTRQSFYNNLEVLTDVLDVVEWHKHEGGELIPSRPPEETAPLPAV